MFSRDVGAELLRNALASEIGIGVVTPDRDRIVKELYAIRQELVLEGEIDLNKLMIFQPANGELWLVKKTVEMPE